MWFYICTPLKQEVVYVSSDCPLRVRRYIQVLFRVKWVWTSLFFKIGGGTDPVEYLYIFKFQNIKSFIFNDVHLFSLINYIFIMHYTIRKSVISVFYPTYCFNTNQHHIIYHFLSSYSDLSDLYTMDDNKDTVLVIWVRG